MSRILLWFLAQSFVLTNARLACSSFRLENSQNESKQLRNFSLKMCIVPSYEWEDNSKCSVSSFHEHSEATTRDESVPCEIIMPPSYGGHTRTDNNVEKLK